MKRAQVKSPFPHTVLERLLDDGLCEDYVLYESGSEARIAGGHRARVSVSADMVTMEGPGITRVAQPAVDPFAQVEALLASVQIEDWRAYGYVAFDLAKYYYPYDKPTPGPALELVIPEFEVHLDAAGARVRGLRADRIRRLVEGEMVAREVVPTAPEVSSADRTGYEEAVRTLVRAIRNDELQKAILSRRVYVPGRLDITGTYAAAKRVNAAARSYCFSLGDVRGVGFSPELLLSHDGKGEVMTNPLAGTRPRSPSADVDARLRRQLFLDAKEVKEHAISVLLAQEELCSVCLPGTVRIHDFMEVKPFRCVQHLSSRVSGQLSPGRSVWDALRALFPGVTVSGIDKRAALQWISRLEPESRSVYGGAFGWIDSEGRADLAIAIRSVYERKGRVELNAGAGIVAESSPESEYVESVNKMSTMLSQIVLLDETKQGAHGLR